MRVITPGFTIEDQLNGLEMLQRIERAGRTCYKSEDKITDESCKAFVKKIIASGHHSVIEHEKVSVRVTCDRGVTHEIVRHRIASYSQESTRYCNYGRTGVTYIQPDFTLEPDDLDLLEKIEQHYNKKLSQGKSPQQARYFLATGLKTEIVMTMNLREWRHFFTLRTATSAHPQMREVARPLLDEFKRLIPIVFDDINYAD